MKRFVPLMLLFVIAVPGVASTHKELFGVPCSELWLAVKDTLRNSGKYGIIAIDNAEMTASYNMGGNLTGKRINSLVLNNHENSCEMQIQTAFSGLANNDEGDMKKRVQASLDKLKASPEGPKVPATAGALPGSPAKLSGSVLTNSDILSLKEAGLSDQLIIDKIHASPAKFSLETSDLVSLKKAGIPDAVVSAMIEASKRSLN